MIDLSTLEGKITYIKGVAGAGKTHELVCAALKSPTSKIHYLSLGRENAKNTRKRMPKNVTCSSFHALARNKMNIADGRIVGFLTLSDLNKQLAAFGLSPKEAKILESIKLLTDLFCLSNTDFSRFFELHQRNESIFPRLDKDERTEFYRLFSQYWRLLWVKDSTAKVTHDMYLKAYEQNVAPIALDYLFVDEAQDMNDAMLSLVEKLAQRSPMLKTIVFCDIHQSIFSFRGVSSKLKHQNFKFTLNMTRRFGPELASVVNLFMSEQNAKQFVDIIGAPNKTTQINHGRGIDDLITRAGQKQKPTVVSRYNITLWHLINELTKKGLTYHLLGGGYDDLDFLESLAKLHNGEKQNTKALKGISYARYKQKAELSQDTAALLSCRFVENIKEDHKGLFGRLKQNISPIRDADVLLTTTHQCKGLEFNHVVMADDFKKSFNEKTGHFIPLPEEDVNLIYTAMTRAKSSLTLPRSWAKLTLP